MEIVAGIIAVSGTVFSAVAGWLMYKHSGFFLSKRFFYVNSGFQVLEKRLSMSLKVSGTILLLSLLLAGAVSSRNEQPEKKQTGKTRKKHTKIRNQESKGYGLFLF